MKLLLDTHALLAILFDPDKLSAHAAAAVGAPDNGIFVSAISPYELEVKKAAGRMSYPLVANWEAAVAQAGFNVLPVTIAHGVAAATLPRHHKDPWDRMLVAQAALEAMTLVTKDGRIARYAVPTLW